MMRRKWMYIAPLAMLGMVLFAFLGGTLVQLLWNWLLPPLFGLREVTFWQALGLLALCRVLFGGSGFMRGSGGSGFGRRMRGRWHAMTPEERERFRHGVRDYCGFEPPAGSESKPSV